METTFCIQKKHIELTNGDVFILSTHDQRTPIPTKAKFIIRFEGIS